MKDRVFLFDIDGTLTPAREKMVPEFEEWFYDFVQKNDVYLISGSDRNKTLEQISQKVYDACLGVYQCNGSEHWCKNRRIKSSNWEPSYELKHYLETVVSHSKYPVKTGRHIEKRTGMINFSTVGRGATPKQRKEYYEWDKKINQRVGIATQITRKFKGINATIGGEISIDIYPAGADKSRVAIELKDHYREILFYGDKLDFGGNDFSIATYINLAEVGKATQVTDWQHTWNLLKEFT
jgi:phosphomannomutase